MRAVRTQKAQHGGLSAGRGTCTEKNTQNPTNGISFPGETMIVTFQLKTASLQGFFFFLLMKVVLTGVL